jgi:hypothetical protein
MVLLQQYADIFMHLLNGFRAAFSPYLPIVYVSVCMVAALALFKQLWRHR